MYLRKFLLCLLCISIGISTLRQIINEEGEIDRNENIERKGCDVKERKRNRKRRR